MLSQALYAVSPLLITVFIILADYIMSCFETKWLL
jgi:hypothetical protein